MDKCQRILLPLILLLAGLPAVAETEEELVGSVTDVKGTVHVIHGDQDGVVAKGARLYTSDVLRTDADSSVGVVLRDDTTLSLGASSELKMSEFKFKPDEGILGMTLRVAKGTLVYISGQISKLSPGSAQIETPAGVAAVRGTKLMVEVPAAKESKQKEKNK